MKRAALGLVVIVAGCSLGGEAKTIDEARLDDLLLQPGDVDPGFRRTYVRNLGGRPLTAVRYRRVRTPGRPAPMTIESSAAIFVSDDAADESLDVTREAAEENRSWQPIDEPGVGDESFAATRVWGGVRHYDVVWREANATGALRVAAAEDDLPLAGALALARKQDRRMEHAAD